VNQSGGRAVSLSAERATDVSSNVHSRQPTPRADPFRFLPPRAARAGAAPVRRSGGPAVRQQRRQRQRHARCGTGPVRFSVFYILETTEARGPATGAVPCPVSLC